MHEDAENRPGPDATLPRRRTRATILFDERHSNAWTIRPEVAEEINPSHPLVTRLKYENADSPQFADWSHILFDQAMLAEGGSLSDTAAFVKRLNEMLLAK